MYEAGDVRVEEVADPKLAGVSVDHGFVRRAGVAGLTSFP